MATHEISILGSNTRPDDSGLCWMEPFSVLATNDVWKLNVFMFGSSNAAEPTARIGLHGTFTVPQNYVGTARIVVIWTATAILGNVAWDFDYRTVGGDDTTSLDQTGTEQTITVTDAAPGAALRRLRVELTPTAGNFAPGETVAFTLFRDGSDAADTMAASAILFALLFRYNDV
jgi:hypothetical protein